MRDPRNHRRYRTLRALWLRALGDVATCHACRCPIDLTLPGTHRWGPTIEHTVPIRHILAMATDDAHALAMACDTSAWAVSHNHCNSQQGQRVTAAGNAVRNQHARRDIGASRIW